MATWVVPQDLLLSQIRDKGFIFFQNNFTYHWRKNVYYFKAMAAAPIQILKQFEYTSHTLRRKTQ